MACAAMATTSAILITSPRSPIFRICPARLRIPTQRYAVFSHRDPVSSIRRTWKTIWAKWLPESGLEVADAPSFERYGETFDPRSGTGWFEIWIPLKG